MKAPEKVEWLDVVDEEGRPTGERVERGEAHRRGIRHATAHLWLVRGRGADFEVLLQKRSEGKDSFPGCWDISSAGHVPAGEDVMASAVRELREELGVEAQVGDLRLVGRRSFETRREFHGRPFWNRQVSFVLYLRRDGAEDGFRLQAEEVSEVRWMKWTDCVRGIAEGAFAHCLSVEELEMVRAAAEAEGGG